MCDCEDMTLSNDCMHFAQSNLLISCTQIERQKSAYLIGYLPVGLIYGMMNLLSCKKYSSMRIEINPREIN